MLGDALALFVLLGGAPQAAPVPSPATAEYCGRCHRSIHEAWKSSAHARATESRLFQDALEQAETRFGARARRMCLSCHAPVAVLLGDMALLRKVSWEGITCDYCHSVQSVSMTGPNAKAVVAFSNVKSGPLKDASASAHGASYSAVHVSSLACVACHEYRNPLGFPVLTTYSEWQNSRAAKEGQPCQSCHMYRVAADVVDPRIQRSKEAKVNLHQMPGSHSLEQLSRSIKLNLLATREPSQLKVTVEVVSRTAGHYVPTGSPRRQLVLEVTADTYDGQHFRGERVYRRTVADPQGRPIDREDLAFLEGAKVLSDTRLAPDEKRTEEFFFPIPTGVSTDIKLKAWYYYSPAAEAEGQQRVSFLTLSRLVR